MHPALQPNPLIFEHLRPPSADRTVPGMALSLLAHAGLVAALAFGVSWRSESQATLEAELWSSIPQSAAPAPEPAPPPPPERAPEAPPRVVRPSPPPAQAKAETEADIALEKSRQARLEKQRQEAAAQEKAQKQREAQQEKERDAKAQADKKAQKLKEEQDRKDKQAKELAKQEAQSEAAREQARQDQLRRMQAQLGGSGQGGSSGGQAARDSGPSEGYAGRIVARIKPNIRLLDPVAGNPEAVVEVRVTPDGSIIGRKLVRSSGNKVWDEAVLLAVDKTERLPRDVDGRIPPVFELRLKPQ